VNLSCIMNTNDSVETVWNGGGLYNSLPKHVKQINDKLYIDTSEPNNIKIGMHEVRVNDSVMSMR